ncbi:MAG TPA: hypothetical protein DIU39_05850 [Flavobacteriales bacterium]|nr:hypothetical protein [Flavobacteriales bacterium]|tara:strand:+ start:52361 stop:53065 length:705 start_codon:yes stop_codon:yes gene_type:complete
MKKSLSFSLFALLLFISFNSNAQCTPDPQYTSPGIYPDTTTNLPHAQEGQPYSTVMTQVVPQDTVINFIPVTIDSVVVTNFTGFPANFSYSCDNPGCSWPGGTSGCVLITGNPTVGQAGTYPLTGYVDAYAGGLGIPSSYTVDGYKLVIDPAAGVFEIKYSAVSVYPNPATDEINFKFSANGNLEIINITGQVIYQTNATSSTINLDIETYVPGVYFYKFVSGNKIYTGKFIKK